MFNLGTLLQVSALTMGVASATPICNAQENHVLTTEAQTQVNNYTINLEQANRTVQTITDTFEEGAITLTYNDQEAKTNWLASNNYVNIIGTTYITTTKYNLNGNKALIQNYENLNSSYGNDEAKATRFLTILQLTPYNYNINNDIDLEFTLQIGGWTNSYNDSLTINKQYIIKNVYQTIQDDWTQYINKQIVKYTGKTIKNDIEDVNNNFYYTKTTELLNVTDEEEITDNIVIGLTPNTTNYIVIEYIPTVDTEYYNYNLGTTEPWPDALVPCNFNDIDLYYITLYGTNIIPDGTYEVIDLPGLMWQILTMPFAFVSQAFNLTLFPGTPYQVNISNLFLI